MTGTITLAFVKELFDYNYWARDRLVQVCSTLTAEQFVRPLGGSFESVHGTLAHMIAAERLWLERWKGRPARALQPPEQFPVTSAGIAECWVAVEREMRAYLDGLSEATIELPVSYVNFKGETWEYALWRMMVHVLNHQSYHRGQASTLLRQLGAQPPSLDFLAAHDMGLRA